MKWVFLILVLFIGFLYFSKPNHSSNGGMVIRNAPLQFDHPNPEVFQKNGFKYSKLADFKVSARVLHTAKYTAGNEAQVSTVDLALGWGAMSDSNVLKCLKVEQEGRFYYYKWSGDPPVPPDQISLNSANMHMIADSDAIEKKLESIHAGDLVDFEGFLVQVDSPTGWNWKSSVTRTDTGAGACEVVYVTKLSSRPVIRF